MDKKELALNTRQELLKIAGKFQIRYRSRMRKNELISAIIQAEKVAGNKSPRPQIKAKKVLTKMGSKSKNKKLVSRKLPEKSQSSSRAPVYEEPQAPLYVDRGKPLPQTYTQDKLVALVRDPHWVYLYWELSGTKAQNLLDQFGGDRLRSARWIIKIHNLSEDSSSEVPVLLESYSWYLNVPENSELSFEMGCYLEGKHYLQVLKAAKVQTPRSRPSDLVDDHWVIMEEQFQKLLAYHQIGEYSKPTSPAGEQYSGNLTRKKS